MTNKKIMLVEAGSVRHRYLLARVWRQPSRLEATSRKQLALFSWLQKVGYAVPLAAGPKSSRLNFVSPRKPLLRVPMTAPYVERAYRGSVVAALRSER